MSTERHDQVRVTLYGCRHRPKVSAMCTPRLGDDYFCLICRRSRKVVGLANLGANGLIKCQHCKYVVRNVDLTTKLSKKRLLTNAIRHANSRVHTVDVVWDSVVHTVRPEKSVQLPLIDDLLLP